MKKIDSIDVAYALPKVKQYLQDTQDQFCEAFTAADEGGSFIKDDWQKLEGGEGRTCVLTQGNTFERIGIGFSDVYGQALPPAATKRHPELKDCSFNATGISIIAHPNNPYVPTAHANIRFFVAQKEGMQPVWWFGGGYDLTPYYGFEEDCRAWHQAAKTACDSLNPNLYAQFKSECDRYFYIKHREEPRGIGGIFFDDLNEQGFEVTFNFVKRVADSFLTTYLNIAKKRKNHPYGKRQKQFQLYRRGRYVEFNLIYDRGTLFGLQFGGRVESILMSLPPQVRWEYNWHPEPGTPEAELYERFLAPREWV